VSPVKQSRNEVPLPDKSSFWQAGVGIDNFTAVIALDAIK
jgi:hypothetical protein